VTDNEMLELSGIELLYKLQAARKAMPVVLARDDARGKIETAPIGCRLVPTCSSLKPPMNFGHSEKSFIRDRWHLRAGRAAAKLARPAGSQSFTSLIRLSQSAGWNLTS
jgi:hypothetical protein